MTWQEVRDAGELRALLGPPGERARTKERAALTEIDRAWLAASPLCLVGTSDAEGRCDVSPKGDPPGSLVEVLDERTIALAERPGNRRADGYHNVLENPHVGLNFLVPGRGDTLRVNGRARLVREAPFLEEMARRGRRPVLALVVEVETVFFHCAKAFLRSRLWEPDTWQPDALPPRSAIAAQVEPVAGETMADLERHYSPAAYERSLY